MKLWNKSSNIDSRIESFTIGNDPEYDMLLAPYDIRGSQAHAKMLHKVGFLTNEELEAILGGLEKILGQVKIGSFKIEEGVEDIHSQVEFSLIQMVGEPGKKLHLARSRNDQIAVDLKLYYRDQLSDISKMVIKLINSLISKAESAQDILMPGYTHSQAGMISSFGLWYGSFAEALMDDLRVLNTMIDVNNQNPLGSAAGYGSSLPIDRLFTTVELGFSNANINSIYAQASRGKTEYNIGFALSNIALTINRLAGDLCLYSNENYAFMKLPDALTTGSSIMPHKRNPDVMELVRAKCNQVISLPMRVQNLLVNMQTGYHRDYQLLKEVLFPELRRIQEILDIVNYCIPLIQERKDILEDDRYKYCYTVENINDLVNKGMAFRDAYHQVKEEVNSGTFEPVSKNPKHTHLGSIGNPGIKELRQKLKALI